MTLGRNLVWRAALVWAVAMACSATAQVPMPQAPTPSAPAATAPSAREAEIAAEAYSFLYPLVIMDITRQQQTHKGVGQINPWGASINHFNHSPEFPPGNFKGVVRPNFDTLYSTAWLDLAKEPMVLSIGDTHGRYYMMPLYDMWTDTFAVPGSETLPPKGGAFLITAPGWQGKTPIGLQRIEAPTPFVWIIGRVQTNGVQDYPEVHAIQKNFILTPLSQWGKATPAPKSLADASRATPPAAEPGLDLKTPPLMQVNAMSAEAFFTRALRMMATNPAHGIDQPMLARMKLIGLTPRADFSFSSLAPSVQAALKKARDEGPSSLMRFALRAGQNRQGWRVITQAIGTYGVEYNQRAAIAMWGLGANRANDAIYPRADLDKDGKPIDGGHTYVVHFKAGELPPVKAFWSLTAYTSDGFPEPNALNRYALGDRDPLVKNPDGSLDLYLQAADPGDAKRANWLPIPLGRTSLNLRLYLPKPEALDGRWNLPTISRTDAAP